jgi:hypothetical protein
MRSKPNQDIRAMIKKSNVHAYEVADLIGVHENTLFRMLRRQLTDEEKKRIFIAIETLEERNGE